MQEFLRSQFLSVLYLMLVLLFQLFQQFFHLYFELSHKFSQSRHVLSFSSDYFQILNGKIDSPVLFYHKTVNFNDF
jgi:hypothetical protein